MKLCLAGRNCHAHHPSLIKSGEWSAYSLITDSEETTGAVSLPDFRVFAMVPKRWSLMGRYVIDNWVEIWLQFKELLKSSVEAEFLSDWGEVSDGT